MAGRGRRKKNNNRAGKLCIGLIVIAFVAVMSVQIIRVYQKDQEYIQQEASLQKQLEDETARGEQLSNYETYTKSQQYVEDTAKSKLGLAYDNEIIFKEAKK
ncbi:septum formation initiator family protein [Roseburia rectibacter]|jgi:cell division protein DivIC|uniref:septum formation initiator family protein n=1 Tax=Roseburia TaxID=841 RepID=UPI000E4C43E6|nr:MULTISPECIES: septum formation initiator family protein [Roseburia]RHF94263.1 septum formation initiator family protein [Roseburia sp. AM23-20]UMZ00816.1 septum formation initiator family protein [Roseburia rectibacter]